LRQPGAVGPGPGGVDRTPWAAAMFSLRADCWRRIDSTSRSATGVQRSRVSATSRNYPVQTHQQAIRREDSPLYQPEPDVRCRDGRAYSCELAGRIASGAPTLAGDRL